MSVTLSTVVGGSSPGQASSPSSAGQSGVGLLSRPEPKESFTPSQQTSRDSAESTYRAAGRLHRLSTPAPTPQSSSRAARAHQAWQRYIS